MKNKNTIIITEEMINSDPYGYTYKEICDCVGEKKARSLMHALHKEKPQKKYQTMSINDIYNIETTHTGGNIYVKRTFWNPWRTVHTGNTD